MAVCRRDQKRRFRLFVQAVRMDVTLRRVPPCILQADAYGGYGELYQGGRAPGPVLEAGCFAHARRKFFELADVEGAARKKSRGERTGQLMFTFQWNQYWRLRNGLVSWWSEC